MSWRKGEGGVGQEGCPAALPSPWRTDLLRSTKVLIPRDLGKTVLTEQVQEQPPTKQVCYKFNKNDWQPCRKNLVLMKSNNEAPKN